MTELKKTRKPAKTIEATDGAITIGSFEQLASGIRLLHDSFRHSAASSVNRLLTCRNWLIGMYIVEYEQKGADRAAYGAALLDRLSLLLSAMSMHGVSVAALRNHRQFYEMYPQLRGTILTEADNILPPAIQQQPAGELRPLNNQGVSSHSPEAKALLRHFSFTHFVELMRITDPLKRAFYEVEGIAGNWSVPQLKRQIGSLLYERTGLSTNKTAVVNAAHKQNVPASIDDIIRDPYVLEFSGLPESPLYSERELETALLDHV